LDRVIQTELKDPLSNEILFGRLAKGGKAHAVLVENKIVFEFRGE
jgi:ATP-dependent Clp protease ATP-binding subunit ClpA